MLLIADEVTATDIIKQNSGYILGTDSFGDEAHRELSAPWPESRVPSLPGTVIFFRCRVPHRPGPRFNANPGGERSSSAEEHRDTVASTVAKPTCT